VRRRRPHRPGRRDRQLARCARPAQLVDARHRLAPAAADPADAVDADRGYPQRLELRLRRSAGVRAGVSNDDAGAQGDPQAKRPLDVGQRAGVAAPPRERVMLVCDRRVVARRQPHSVPAEDPPELLGDPDEVGVYLDLESKVQGMVHQAGQPGMERRLAADELYERHVEFTALVEDVCPVRGGETAMGATGSAVRVTVIASELTEPGDLQPEEIERCHRHSVLPSSMGRRVSTA
jgi:hypothetical protein